MASIDTTVTKVHILNPIKGLNTENIQVAAAGNFGDAVYRATDGTALLADATDTQAEAEAIGIVIANAKAIGGEVSSTFVANDTVTIAKRGARVYLGNSTAMTIGAKVYISATAGDLDQTAPAVSGNYVFCIGRAISAYIVEIDPQTADATVVV